MPARTRIPIVENYVKQTWEDYDPENPSTLENAEITAEKMNHIEDGIGETPYVVNVNPQYEAYYLNDENQRVMYTLYDAQDLINALDNGRKVVVKLDNKATTYVPVAWIGQYVENPTTYRYFLYIIEETGNSFTFQLIEVYYYAESPEVDF